MERSEYWCEAVADAFDDVGAYAAWQTLTPDQQARIGRNLEGAAEGQSMAFHVPENPMIRQIEDLEASLRKERSKVGCPTCRGRGRVEFGAGPWWVNTDCDACHGEGKVLP